MYDLLLGVIFKVSNNILNEKLFSQILKRFLLIKYASTKNFKLKLTFLKFFFIRGGIYGLK